MLSLGAFGLIGMGVLDSSILFLPFGNDLLLVLLTAREPDRFWLYAVMATVGSLIGCSITDWLSRRLGEAGIEKMVNPAKAQKVQRRLKEHTWWALGLAAIMPPPFPFTVFVIAASALQISRWRVLSAVGAGRFVRFLVLGLLARRFGTQIIRLTESPQVQYFVIGLAVISIVGSVLSIVKWVRSSRGSRTHVAGRTAEAKA
ncbi:MAG TPA: VTT domain-containing protein [Bryobacteraceae bacterium]|nr:VTT domain-containing protein [Bryobacteraceae bacterium]